MFGHDDKPKDDDTRDGQATAIDSNHVVTPVDQPAHSDAASDDDWQHPGVPPADTDDSTDKTEDFTAGQSAPEPDHGSQDHASAFHAEPGKEDSAPAAGLNDDLVDIKQEALGKLSPLIGHLDQSPDEKFRTLMMMIQASDDQGLVKQAYDTALEIEDEKTRAQALLDIVNEINYFTQNPSKSE